MDNFTKLKKEINFNITKQLNSSKKKITCEFSVVITESLCVKIKKKFKINGRFKPNQSFLENFIKITETYKNDREFIQASHFLFKIGNPGSTVHGKISKKKLKKIKLHGSATLKLKFIKEK